MCKGITWNDKYIDGGITLKNRLLLILPVILLVFFCFIGDSNAGTTTLNLTTNSYTLAQGKSLQLTINGVKSKKVKWKSSDKKVAKVSKNGTVSAVKSGKATISGRYKGITFKTIITVEPSGKEYNILLAQDENLEIYLKKVEDGIIYFNFKNKSKKDIRFWSDYLDINGKDYSDITIYDFVYAGREIEIKADGYSKTSKYRFTNGTIKGQIEYDDNTETDLYGKLNFEIEVE